MTEEEIRAFSIEIIDKLYHNEPLTEEERQFLMDCVAGWMCVPVPIRHMIRTKQAECFKAMEEAEEQDTDWIESDNETIH